MSLIRRPRKLPSNIRKRETIHVGPGFLDSNMGDVFLLDYQTYDPHSLAKKYNEAADGRSNVGLGYDVQCGA
jgi:hypothetical protein